MEEKDTIVSLHQEDNLKHKYDKSSDFCRNHVYLQPHDPFEDENTLLSYEGHKIKDNYEGDKFTSSFFVGDWKIIAKEDDIFNGDKEYFGLDPIAAITTSPIFLYFRAPLYIFYWKLT